MKNRYSVYVPTVKEADRIKVFTLHMYDFMVTEISRMFKSDERILTRKIENALDIFLCQSVVEQASNLHENNQQQAEELGDLFNASMGMKLANPWNFIDITLACDHKEIKEIIDNSPEINRLTETILMNWEKIIELVYLLNLQRITKEIADKKVIKKKIDEKEAIEQAIVVSPTHPDANKFRVKMDLGYDHSEPSQIVERFNILLDAALKSNKRKAITSGWEKIKAAENSRENHTDSG
jgi:hypothetical protein